MRFTPKLATTVLACGILLGAVPADAGVIVSFATARFTDAKLRGGTSHGAIRAHLQRLGARYLDRHDTLRITVLDIDRAGDDESYRDPFRPRVLRDSTWPKIRLRYVLQRGHTVVASGEELVADHFYLGRPGVRASIDELRHEKAMLDDWFRQKFAAGR